ncbi:MAG TPA: L,D-transpeptidase [Candidatus Sericytochromatia bacterium]|jgi:lipoprotein-anchoring transpeptidase ErfK/SrfK
MLKPFSFAGTISLASLLLGTPQPHKLVVDLSDAQVSVVTAERVVAKYPVSVGRSGMETPTGIFHVTDMRNDPTWIDPFTLKVYPPSPLNPIGDRWIEFATKGNNKIGFHGTNQEHLIGQPVSSGCVRMKRADLHALYKRVSIGTEVVVQP